MTARAAVAGLGVIAALAYPLVVYLGLASGSVRGAGLTLLVALALVVAPRLAGLTAARAAGVLGPAVGVAALATLGAATADGRFLLALPVLVNALLLATFLASLRGEPMIERFARLMDPALPAERAAYCRRVTWAWCAFFVVNGVISAALALRASLEAWTLWTGLLSYAAMALVLVIEVIVRRRRFPDAPGLVETVRGARRARAGSS